MCIFYVMYYVETDEPLTTDDVMPECLSLGKRGRWSDWFDDTPQEATEYNGVVYKETKTVSK